MFQLIVVVIAIALIAVLAGSAIFYGGDAFDKASPKAIAATLINQGQQISAAAVLYAMENPGLQPSSITLAHMGYVDNIPRIKYKNGIGANPWTWHVLSHASVDIVNLGRPATLQDVEDEPVCRYLESENGATENVEPVESSVFGSVGRRLAGDVPFDCKPVGSFIRVLYRTGAG